MCDTTCRKMTLVEEFEEAFLQCLDSLIIEGIGPTSGDDNRMELEIRIERFLHLARKMDIFFTRKNIILSSSTPKEIFNEDVNELRKELERKEEVLQRQHEKITNWQIVLDCLLETAMKGDLDADASCTYDEKLDKISFNKLVIYDNDDSKTINERGPSTGAEYSHYPATVLSHNVPKFVFVECEKENIRPKLENLPFDRQKTMRNKYEQHEMLMRELQNQLLRLQEMKLEEYRALRKLQQQESEQDIEASPNYSKELMIPGCSSLMK